MKFPKFRRSFVILALLAITAPLALAQKPENATVRVNVTPGEAYIFIDGQPYTHRSHTLRMAPGEYTIGVYNYGYVAQVQKVMLKEGDNPEINARLAPVAETVSGPWGRIQIEGNANDKAAVFLNGMGPEYFVGHIDEMNNDILLQQRLIVPVGTYELILVNPKETKPFFTGQVEVRPNERVIVDVAPEKNTRTYKPWKNGEKYTAFKRFKAGIATATIAVAPVTANIALDKNRINCGENVRLTWNSAEAAHVFITANGKPLTEPTLAGEQKLQPLENTKYELRVAGPGGTVISSTAVDVNTAVKASLMATPSDVTFNKVGDKAVEPATSNLKWTASNADAVRIDPIGSVNGASGTQPLTLVPTQTSLGALNETKAYTITATNICGGSDTQTATVHLTGTIEPEPVPETVAELKLPQTASPLPLLGLLGFGSVFTAFALRGFRKGH